ncbi:hypothetical protein V5799_017941 [Amblyomma americanum]|uniref:Uncharacterized protein n=1 Tax=Amblyomma americanum TaxID=6943 RepID=A0AAQ4F0T5_AMBAM
MTVASEICNSMFVTLVAGMWPPRFEYFQAGVSVETRKSSRVYRLAHLRTAWRKNGRFLRRALLLVSASHFM